MAQQAQNYSQFPVKIGLIQKEKLRRVFFSLFFTFQFPCFSFPKDSPKLSHFRSVINVAKMEKYDNMN